MVMERLWKAVLLGASMATVVVTSGCDRGLKGDSGRIVIQAPETFGKVGALAALPLNRKVCYGVNVTNAGLIASTSTCSPPSEILVG